MDPTNPNPLPRRARRFLWLAVAALVLGLGCGSFQDRPGSGALHRWWAGLGPVLPHDSFPADCNLCHVGSTWTQLVDDFHYDHLKETGVALEGAHDQAQCIRCHNDRGPVEAFAAKGCGGCHEDVHQAELGPHCTECHTQSTWQPYGQIARHDRTRFPLTGAHLAVACHRCHEGAFVGRFGLVDTQCVSCHQDDLGRAVNPPHLALGLTANCDRCHFTTSWNQAVVR